MRVECDRPPVARTWAPFAARTRRHAPGSDGFTLIELVIALSLSAILFAGLAAIMGTSLRTLSVTRSRGQANEIAAQGIEDLQRFSFTSLVLCNTPTVPPGGTVPTGFTAANTVLAVTCANATLESPCPAPATTGLTGYPVPTANYTCTRYGIAFAVSRYISWADTTLKTNKRLAVVVDWTDQVGRHEVSQQSSVRAPDQDAIIGGTPPSLTSVSTAPGRVWVDASGFLVTSTGTPQSIALVANAAGLLATDKVSAYFLTEDPVSHVLTTATIPLTSADGSTWTGSIPGSGASGAPTFPTAGGTQYVGFTAIRQSDGKANSILSVPEITFCNNPSAANTAGTCAFAAGVPSISTVALSPTLVAINSDGTLFGTATLTITATTSNLYASTTASDSVIAVVETLAGASQVVLKPTCSLTSTLTACNTWKVTIDSTMALRFAAGGQQIAVLANQVASAPYSTASYRTGQVTFQ